MAKRGLIAGTMTFFAAALFGGSVLATTKALPFPAVTQEQSQWCWAAVSHAIFRYYGSNLAQCVIAEYVRTQATWHSYGPVNCCENVNQGCNYWNYIMGASGSIQDILEKWGLKSNAYIRRLEKGEVENIINDNRPFVICWAYTSGSGHFLVGYGIDGSLMNYMDPLPGEGLKIGSYDWVVSGSTHTWTHTAVVETPWSIPNQVATLKIETSTGGTTSPVAGSYSCGVGTSQSVIAIPSARHQFFNWSGDVSGSTVTAFVTMTGPKTVQANFQPVLAPLDFQGRKLMNRSLLRTEYVNELNWQNNPQNLNIAKTRIYVLDGETWMMMRECETTTTRYFHRGVAKLASSTYRIVAVTNQGYEGFPAEITVK